MIRFGLFCLLGLITLKVFSQDKPVQGIVFDKDSKERLASISIHDINNHITAYNNLKGEFTIKANVGDMLVFTRQDYHPDTIKIQNAEPLAIYMAHNVVQLREVTVHDSLLTPDQQLAKLKEEFSRVYSPSLNPDFFSTDPYSGIGISIDAIWNSISREGRNAAALRAEIQRDYEQYVIDYRFSKTFVSRVTGLKGDRLKSFMTRYRPGYFTVKNMTDYEFITMIKANYRRFLRTQRTYSLPPLTRT